MGSTSTIEFGKSMRDQFQFDPDWVNMNNGSFGTIPRVIKEKQIEIQMLAEAYPDKYIRFQSLEILDESRAALAKHLNAPIETIVFVPNATTAINAVLRNLVWNADGKDEIISFSTVYGGCGKTIDFITDSNDLVSSRTINLDYPIEDDAIIEKFHSIVDGALAEGKRPKVVMFDIVTSQPGVRFPFEKMTAVCRELGILSLIDGAQGVGMVSLDLSQLDADFVTSNCHKWLFVPRGCAFLYVPVRNQSLMVSSLPTSHGYVPQKNARVSPFKGDPTKTAFVTNFQFTGTIDNSPYMCVKDALEWREKFLGGEERILEYLWNLAKEGGKRAAQILGTEVLENSTGTLTNHAMVNIRLPVKVGGTEKLVSGVDGIVLSDDVSAEALRWAEQALLTEHKTFIPLFSHNGTWYARLSAQVYLDMDDFEWAARCLKEVCAKVQEQEW